MNTKPPEFSIILATYNRPNSLRLALLGLAGQTHRDFEVLIADDGSDEDTAEMVRAMAPELPFPLIFVTQDHSVFHKTKVVNEAVRNSQGEKLLFCDGDCVTFRDFVAIHREHLRPGVFCVGGYIHLDIEQSRRVTAEMVSQGAHEMLARPDQLKKHGKIHFRNQLYRLIGKKNKPKIMGGNFSLLRRDFYAVNGFDERYKGFGAEDTNIRNRLRNYGLVGVSLWTRAHTCHLDHDSIDPPRPNRSHKRESRSRELNLESLRTIRAVEGIEDQKADG